MYNSDTELLFPSRVIPQLQSLRSEAWRDLVQRVNDHPPTSLDHLAFVLMMVRLDGCMTCNADSFRAMRGCTQCAVQTVRRFRGDDKELIALFNETRAEIEQSFAAGKKIKESRNDKDRDNA